MDSRQKAAEHVYEDFEPTIEWERDSGADTLMLYLPGFRKEQLKVQVTSSRKLRIRGERQVGENKWSRFLKEIPIPSNYNSNEISAKLEKGTLLIKHPIFIIPDTHAPQPPQQAPKPPQEKPPKPQPPQPPPSPAYSFKKKPPPAAAAGSFKPPQPPPPVDSLIPQKSLPRNQKEEALKPNIEPLKPEKHINEDLPEASPAKVDDVPQKENGLNQFEQKQKDNSDIKQRNLIGSINDNFGNSDKSQVGSGIISAAHTFAASNYRQVLSHMVKELKNPRKLLDSFMAILSLLLLRLYAMITKAIRSFNKSDA